jgi:hypothetical protein
LQWFVRRGEYWQSTQQSRHSIVVSLRFHFICQANHGVMFLEDPLARIVERCQVSGHGGSLVALNGNSAVQSASWCALEPLVFQPSLNFPMD